MSSPRVVAPPPCCCCCSRGSTSVPEVFVSLCVSEMQTSPTDKRWHRSPKRCMVRSGSQEDQPWPNTKNGCSRVASTVTCKDTGKALPDETSRRLTVVCTLLRPSSTSRVPHGQCSGQRERTCDGGAIPFSDSTEYSWAHPKKG